MFKSLNARAFVAICFFLSQNMFGALFDLSQDLSSIRRNVRDMKGSVERWTSNAKKETETKLHAVEEVLRDIKLSQEESLSKCPGPPLPLSTRSSCKRDSALHKLVRDLIEEYNADKTARPDFALETAGGSIVTTRDTEEYPHGLQTKTLFGIPICYGIGAKAIIQPSVHPGECWAIKGSCASAVVKLIAPVHIDGIALEHISKAISPAEEITTAPKEFSVWGLMKESDKQGHLLGQFIYNKNGPALQSFNIPPTEMAYPYVEFKLHSNHGDPRYTCIYRLRVHGSMMNRYDGDASIFS